MNKFKNYLLMAAGFAVLAAVVSAITAGPAIAQAVKTALVHDVGVTTVLTDTFVTSKDPDGANNPAIELDTSGAKTIRVNVSSSSCGLCSNVQVQVYSDFTLIDLMTLKTGFPPDPATAASRVYEVPAMKLQLRFANLGAGATNSTKVTVLARSN